jgi:hypothetical protein
VFEPRVREAVREWAVIGQEQKALAIVVEAAGGIDPGDGHERFERGPARSVRELAQNAVRLIEREVVV